MADEEHPSTSPSAPPMAWNNSPPLYQHAHSHHGTPAHEYSGFTFPSPQLPMEPSAFSSLVPQRPLHQHLQPLVMPAWPSMLSSQPHPNYHSIYPSPIQPTPPSSASLLPTPTSTTSLRPASTPRKTLTDLDRKRMCQYAEEHPGSKQTEIGAIFGVERSTVSKVLRQKDKYLYQDDGSKTAIKRPKGRAPDIERALSVWAKNQVKKGNALTDDLIREKARAFATTTTTPDHHVTLSASWIEKFKLKNNLMGARSRKASLATDDLESISAAESSSQTPADGSPASPRALSPSPFDLHSASSHESLKIQTTDDYIGRFSRPGILYSNSTASLNSDFTDAARSSFSPGPLSPTSPFFTPDSGTAPSPFIGPPTAQTTNSTTPEYNVQSLTSRAPAVADQNMSSFAEPVTPRYAPDAPLDPPMDEPSDPFASVVGKDDINQRADDDHQLALPSDSMRPPPLPAHARSRDARPSASVPLTSPEEARQAMQIVLSFFEQQPSGFLDLQESVTVGKLMEKLKLQSRREA